MFRGQSLVTHQNGLGHLALWILHLGNRFENGSGTDSKFSLDFWEIQQGLGERAVHVE